MLKNSNNVIVQSVVRGKAQPFSGRSLVHFQKDDENGMREYSWNMSLVYHCGHTWSNLHSRIRGIDTT